MTRGQPREPRVASRHLHTHTYHCIEQTREYVVLHCPHCDKTMTIMTPPLEAKHEQ